MHKLLVKMKGAYSFVDMSTIPAQESVAGRPFVVAATPLVQRQISMGYMTQIKDLPEEATDEEWGQFFADHEGKVAEALENYVTALEKGPEGEGGDDGEGETDPKSKKAPSKQKKAPAADKE